MNYEKNKDINPEVGAGIANTKIASLETDFTLSYFISDHFTLGLSTNILISQWNITYELSMAKFKYIRNDFLIGPVLRYYTNSGLFLECSTGFGFLHYESPDSPVKWKNYACCTGIGYSHFLTKSIALEPIIKYQHFSKKAVQIEEGKEKTNGIEFSIGFQIFLNSIKIK
jgi:long-subunit fatty acid transport protein